MIILFLIILLSNNKNINPLSINIMIIVFTIIISMKINFINNNNWFSMMMFLVMIGGMMILFLYFNSFMINEEFKSMKENFFINTLMKTIMFSLINIMVFFKLFKILSMNMNLTIMNNQFFNLIHNEMILLMILNNKIITSLIIMIIFLLYSLMVITFLCMNKNLSLRKII